MLDQLGAAMNSGRAIFIHGPAGSGKTYLAERLAGLLQGTIAVPHARHGRWRSDPGLRPDGARSHRRCAGSRESPGSRRAHRHALGARASGPAVLTGGELTLDMLDLRFDPGTRFYQAPPHLKANNGIFIIDDLGRQRCSPAELMNRWIVPMDRRIDYLSLHTGHKFLVPFDVIVVFSSNLPPEQLADGAFLRRIGYKIHVGAADAKPSTSGCSARPARRLRHPLFRRKPSATCCDERHCEGTAAAAGLLSARPAGARCAIWPATKARRRAWIARTAGLGLE